MSSVQTTIDWSLFPLTFVAEGLRSAICTCGSSAYLFERVLTTASVVVWSVSSLPINARSRLLRIFRSQSSSRTSMSLTCMSDSSLVIVSVVLMNL